MLFAFGMPSIGSLVFILVIILALFSFRRLRSRREEIKGENFEKRTLR